MNIKDRYEWIEYKNHRILCTDFSGLNEYEIKELTIYMGKYISSLGVNSIKQLLKVNNIELSYETIKAIEDHNVVKNRLVKRKWALLNADNSIKSLMDFWGKNIYGDILKVCFFENRNSALEWLIEE